MPPSLVFNKGFNLCGGGHVGAGVYLDKRSLVGGGDIAVYTATEVTILAAT